MVSGNEEVHKAVLHRAASMVAARISLLITHYSPYPLLSLRHQSLSLPLHRQQHVMPRVHSQIHLPIHPHIHILQIPRLYYQNLTRLCAVEHPNQARAEPIRVSESLSARNLILPASFILFVPLASLSPTHFLLENSKIPLSNYLPRLSSVSRSYRTPLSLLFLLLMPLLNSDPFPKPGKVYPYGRD
ncbi:hypothetical protein ACFX12_032320 [Malus domestica]